jgi:hypothetical protein
MHEAASFSRLACEPCRTAWENRQTRLASEPAKRVVIYSLLCAAFLCVMGCKRDAMTPVASTSRPSSQPTNTSSITLTIDAIPIEFPQVVLHAQSTGGGVAVQFNTPTANAETGNALNFDLTLEDIDDPANLAGAAWHFRSDDAERPDTLNGIALRGRSAVLEPMDVHIIFGRDGDRATVEIEGQFRWFEPPDAEKPMKIVNVSGRFAAKAP